MKTSISNLIELFESNEITIFEYNITTNQINIKKEYTENNDYHTKLFIELQKITEVLTELDCNYSIDEYGNILL